MILIIGGAYQGKLDFALENFGLNTNDVFNCEEQYDKINKDKKIIDNLDKVILRLVYAGKDEDEILKQIDDVTANAMVVIYTDHSQGIVPLKREERAFREISGRIMTRLAAKSSEVYRIFCGLPQQLK